MHATVHSSFSALHLLANMHTTSLYCIRECTVFCFVRSLVPFAGGYGVRFNNTVCTTKTEEPSTASLVHVSLVSTSKESEKESEIERSKKR